MLETVSYSPVPPRCTYCGGIGHTVDFCAHSYAGSVRRAQLRCTYCGGKDHNYEACTKHAGGGKLPGAFRKED